MALRVLLADESTTIKKVMQLALQDFAVEVKSVQSGIDVLEVAKSFEPDIIFADVLLQKKNGYEVCADVKGSSEYSHIPVVLMWSSFMDLDEQQAAASQADRRLEKPFDVENLRQIVLELVPKTRSQRLAHFLKFPETVTEPLAAEVHAKAEAQVKAPPLPPPPQPPPVPRAPATPPPAPPAPPASSVKAKAPQPPPAPAPAAAAKTAPPPAAATKPAAPSPTAPPPKAQPSSWNMDSFEDINEFAAEVEDAGLEFEPEDVAGAAPPQTPPRPREPGPEAETAGAEGEGFEFALSDDAFQEVRIAKPLAQRGPLPSPETAEPAGLDFNIDEVEEADHAPQASAAVDDVGEGDDNDEAWSHQNLSRFKLDVASLENDDIKLDLEEVPGPESLEHGDFLHHKEAAPVPRGGGLKLTNFDEEAYQLPADTESVPGSAGRIGPMSADRLEEIVRAQSREIIETVVRRIVRDVVPDLATKIIREELNRLLEDSPRESAP